MAVYKFKALNDQGKSVEGRQVAADDEDAFGRIRSRGLHPVTIVAVTARRRRRSGQAVRRKVLMRTLKQLATMLQAVEGSPRATIPSTYVLCTEDQAVHPEHQRIMAARCGRTVELVTDHSPFLSAIGPTADLLVELASV